MRCAVAVPRPANTTGSGSPSTTRVKLRSRAATGRDEALAAVRRTTGELADLAERTAADARAVLVDGRRAQDRATAKARELAQRSLHDPDARPIAKGRLGNPSSPATSPGHRHRRRDRRGLHRRTRQPARRPATRPRRLTHPQRAGRVPRTVTADRGYGEARVEDALTDPGVKTVVIPRTGRPGQARQALEHRRAFCQTITWGTGCEGRTSISALGPGPATASWSTTWSRSPPSPHSPGPQTPHDPAAGRAPTPAATEHIIAAAAPTRLRTSSGRSSYSGSSAQPSGAAGDARGSRQLAGLLR